MECDLPTQDHIVGADDMISVDIASPNVNNSPDLLPLTHKEQKVLYDRQWVEEKRIRHMDNMQIFQGFHHGTYFDRGVGQERG